MTLFRRAVFATIALLLGSASAFAQFLRDDSPAPPSLRPPFRPTPDTVEAAQVSFAQYSAKFLCGEAREGASVRPGTYETSINIHNPDFLLPVYFVKKAVRAERQREPQLPLREPLFDGADLAADLAERVDCKYIRGLLHPQHRNDPFIEGFVVLLTLPIPWDRTRELDVVAVYTVDTPQRGISLEIEPIAARFLPRSSAAGKNLHEELLRRRWMPEPRPQ